MIALLSVIAVSLLNLHNAGPSTRCQRAKGNRADRCALYVVVLSGWRHKKAKTWIGPLDFFYALARLGGHQNRKGDHQPGWLILWRGWMALQHMVDGADAIGFKSCG